ncbi:hypothetical protein AOC36_05700 [Erysipelothrix larvae]|uniref:Capsule synthesis protein CapA domain-containing protein n=1 Tax=Erysipelothrix larvae TaxID=1514105 RepID=A0A0X8GZU5_9FIRM|nr:CapA family protein [Erysipelothrix larvae]AMC93490.1 hypothetical protein AOC36_05700 [Erysipelothrix larvae]
MKQRNRWLLPILAILIVVFGGSLTYIALNKNKQPDIVKPTPDPTPEPTPDPVDKVTSVDVLTLGDLLYHQSFLGDPSVDAFSLNFKHMTSYFDASDLVIGNYETTTNPNMQYQGYPLLNTPKEAITAIKNAGIDVLNTNNNHSMDSRLEGVKTTLEHIRAEGLKTVGTNLAGEDKRLDLEINEIKIGILSYSFGYNGFEANLTHEEMTTLLSVIDEGLMKSQIAESKAKNDATLVIMHWGVEYQINANSNQKALAQKLAEWGVDVVIGGHPHVVQETEMIDNTYVIYSLGNFVSNQRYESLKSEPEVTDAYETERGLVAGFTITKDHQSGKVTIDNKTYIPTWVNRYEINGNRYYEVIPTEDYIADSSKFDHITSDLDTRIRKTQQIIMDRVSGS